MKIKVFMAILALSHTVLYAQGYYPLVEDGKSWNVLFEPYHPPYIPPYYWTENYLISGDTLIDTTTYAKLCHSTEEFPVSWDLHYLVREDSNKHVWIRYPDNEEELLLYDFSVHEGDSVLAGLFDPITLQVDSISTIPVNGDLRKIIFLSFEDMPGYIETWTEGLGSDKGIIWSGTALLVGGWSYLLCVHQAGQVIYMNPEYMDCYVMTGTADHTGQAFRVYPNPARDYLHIRIPPGKLLRSVVVLSLTGQVVMKAGPDGGPVDISGLDPGMYLVKVEYDRSCATGKIIIQ